MKNFKSPGIDGFTVEFYKFFWNDIKIPLVKCLNESLDNGKFSVSQRQGLITMPFFKITEIAGTFFSFDLPFCLCPCYNTIYPFLSQDF
jgi:hypothetical protein